MNNGLLLGVGRFDIGSGATPPPALAWSTTVVADPSALTFTNSDLTVEKTSVGIAGYQIGAATVGRAIAAPDAIVGFTINAVAGAVTAVGVIQTGASLNTSIGNFPDSAGYYTNGEVVANGTLLATIATYTAGDFIEMEIHRPDASTKQVRFRKNAGAFSSYYNLTTLDNSTWYPAWCFHTTIGGKITITSSYT